MNIAQTYRLQRYVLAICTALGAVAGLVFAAGTRAAFQILFATFMWSLIAGTVVAIVVSLSGRVTTGDWRAGLRLSAAIYFSDATAYLLALLLCATLGPAQDIAGAVFTLPTMLRIVAPGIYFAASIMTLSSILFYWPAPAGAGRIERDRL